MFMMSAYQGLYVWSAWWVLTHRLIVQVNIFTYEWSSYVTDSQTVLIVWILMNRKDMWVSHVEIVI